MSQVRIERFDDFTGGLNLRADQFQLAKNESPDMLNVEIDPRGGLFTRGGYREINPTPVSVTWTPERLYMFRGDTSRMMLSTEDRILHSSGGDFSVLEYSSGNPIVGGSAHGPCVAQWGDTLYIATGLSGVQSYRWKTGDAFATALTISGTASNQWQNYNSPTGTHFPQCEHVAVHSNKMFAANTREAGVNYPNRVRWSHEGLPRDWKQDDYIDFNEGGMGVQGIVSVAGQLMVFKPGAVYLVYGYDSTDFQVVLLSQRLGVLSHHHYAVAENGVYFYSHPDGLFFYNGSQMFDLFANLKPIFDLKQVNDQALDQISVSYVNRRVWLSMPYSTSGNPVSEPTVNFVFDPTLNEGAWLKHASADGFGFVGGADWVAANGDSQGWLCHPTKPHVLRVDDYSSETDQIEGVEEGFESYYRTKWVDGGLYSMKKMFRRPDFVVKQVDTQRQLQVKVYHNYEEAPGNERKLFNVLLPPSADGMLWGTGIWGQDYWGIAAEGAQVLRGSNLGLARSVQLLLTGPVGLAWGLDSIAYKYNTRKVTG